MSTTTPTITRHTLLPLSMAVVIVVAAFVAGGEWTGMVEQVKANTDTVQRHEKTLDYLKDAMVRVETKLGTLPSGSEE